MNTFTKILLNVSLVAMLIILSFPQPALARSESNADAWDLLNSGIEKAQSDRYEQAISDFTQLINLNSQYAPAAYSNRCLAHLQLGNEPAAISDCTKAIDLNPNNIEAYLDLGLAYYRQGNYQAALQPYQAIITRKPHDWRVYYNRGLVYFALEDYSQAIADYHQALNSSDSIAIVNRAEIYSDRGLSYLLSDYLTEAIADFDRAISLNSNNERAYFNRACAHHRQRNYLAAIKDFTQVLQLNPTRTEAYVNRGWVRYQLGLKQDAIADLQIALYRFQEQGEQLAYQQTLALINQIQGTTAIATGTTEGLAYIYP